MEGYKAEIKNILYGDFDWREKIQIKDVSSAMSIESDMTFKPLKVAVVHIENPYTAEGEKEYDICVIVAEEGIYKTSSDSFISSIVNILQEVLSAGAESEDWEIKVKALKSKNNQGSFFTAEIV